MMIQDSCDLNCKECRSATCHTGKILMPERFEAVSFTSSESQFRVDEIVEMDEILKAMALAEQVFCSCEAPDQTEEGIANFTAKLRDSSYVEMLRVYVAYDGEKIVGMAATLSSGTYLALLYVDEAYQKCGIGKALVAQVIHDDPMGLLSVHSAPAAVGFYENCGFVKQGEMMVDDAGVRITPMVFYRKKKEKTE